MTHLVTDKCIACKYTDCVEVCPVDCFYAIDDMLIIDPDACIDCGVCIPECPIDAIVDENMFIQDGDNIGEILEEYNVAKFCNMINDIGYNSLHYFICQGFHKLLCDGIDIFNEDNNNKGIIKFKELCTKNDIFFELFNKIFNTIHDNKYNEKNAIIFAYIVNYFGTKSGNNITKKESSLTHEDSDTVDYDNLEYKFKLINKYW